MLAHLPLLNFKVHIREEIVPFPNRAWHDIKIENVLHRSPKVDGNPFIPGRIFIPNILLNTLIVGAFPVVCTGL